MPVASEYEFVSAGMKLPPTECPILIKVPAGTSWPHPLRNCSITLMNTEVLAAERRSHIQAKDGQMEYHLQEGGVVTGRFDWTYP